MQRQWLIRGGALLSALALGATACGGSSSSGGSSKGPTGSGGTVSGTLAGNQKPFATANPLNPSTHAGGTLNVGVRQDVDYMDPGRTYYGFSWDLHQVINRTLLQLPVGANFSSPQPIPDIATGPATSTDEKTWKYTLRSGIKFQDGTPVTSKTIKYSIERVFATDVINGGPTYDITFLCPGGTDKSGACKSYTGPYKDKTPGHLGLSTIETPDDNTIIFHLNQPFSEWNYAMTEFATAPVEPSVDLNKSTGGANYNLHVQATGPYKIASYVPNKHINLVRNPMWSKSTDSVRTALPDAINVKTDYDPLTLDKDIIANNVDFDLGGRGVQPATQAQILRDPALLARTLDPLTGAEDYLSIMQQTPPFNNVHCRKAINWITNKVEYVDAIGGKNVGIAATTMSPPTLAGYKQFDAYPSKDSAGDVNKAKAELQACGKPNGFSTTIVGVNKGTTPQVLTFLQQDLKKIGINAQIKTFDGATYSSSTIGIPTTAKKNGYGIAVAGWGPDWPAPYGYFENILDPRKILPQGNSNYGECGIDDPQLATIIDQALASKTTQEAYGFWQQFDRRVVDTDSCVVPADYSKAVDIFSTRLTNVSPMLYNGTVEMRTVGVSG